MIAEPLEKGLAEDIETGKVNITWDKYVPYISRNKILKVPIP